MKKFLIVVLLTNLLILDLGAGYLVYRLTRIFDGNFKDLDSSQLTEEVLQDSGCDYNCQQKIYTEIDELKLGLVEKSVIVTPLSTNEPVIVTQQSKKTRNITFVPIPGSGSVLNTSWAEISGTDFYLSKSDYPGLTGVYFEANFRLMNGNGSANLRIFDKTHSIAPSGGEISTNSQTSTFVTSGPVYLWEGNNHYVIQARSSTSDTTIFESGRLKIITEN